MLIGIASGRRAKWAVVVFWLIIVAVAGPLSGKLTGAEKNDSSSWLPAKAESTKVLDLQSRFQSPNIFTAVVVYDRPSGLTGADRAKAAADATRFAQVNGVVPGQVTGPILAQDGKAIETLVPVNLGSKGWNGASAAATSLRNIAQANAAGLSVHIAGPLGSAADSANSFKGIDGILLLATLVVVIVLLLITYRSPVLWLFPVISAGIALVSAEALIYLLAAHAGLTVNAQSAGILYVLVFGAGTDYALLLTARYREELRRHEDRHEAMALAIRRAGPAIRNSWIGRRIGEYRWTQAERLLGGPAGRTLVMVQFMPVLNYLVPLLAGTLKVPLKRFLRLTGIGAVIYCSFYATLGALAGGTGAALGDATGRLMGLLVVAVTVAGLGVTVLTRVVRQMAEEAAPGPTEDLDVVRAEQVDVAARNVADSLPCSTATAFSTGTGSRCP